MTDRSLKTPCGEVLNSITWEQEGFALATGREENSGSFTGLAIPHRDSWSAPIADAVLLVRPDIALAQSEVADDSHGLKAAEQVAQAEPKATAIPEAEAPARYRQPHRRKPATSVCSGWTQRSTAAI